MATPTIYADGNPTIGASEYSLPDETTSGVPVANTDKAYYSVSIDVSGIAGGDFFLMKVYEKGEAGGTQQLVASWPFVGPQGALLFQSPSFLLGNGWDWTMKKISGTDRPFRFTLWSTP